MTAAAVSAGTYSLAETGPAGYSASAWSCTAGTLTGSSLVLAAGETASCSITNTFIPPQPAQLTLAKSARQHRRRDGPGDRLDPQRHRPDADLGSHRSSPAITDAAVGAGTYSLAEAGPAGYSASAWACTGGTLTGSSLVLAAGETASCSITNTFVRPARAGPPDPGQGDRQHRRRDGPGHRLDPQRDRPDADLGSHR